MLASSGRDSAGRQSTPDRPHFGREVSHTVSVRPRPPCMGRWAGPQGPEWGRAADLGAAIISLSRALTFVSASATSRVESLIAADPPCFQQSLDMAQGLGEPPGDGWIDTAGFGTTASKPCPIGRSRPKGEGLTRSL